MIIKLEKIILFIICVAISTIIMTLKYHNKQKPKKPKIKEMPYSEEYGINFEIHCPTCGTYIGYFSEGMNEPEQMDYCSLCGQHISKKWNEE